MNNCCRNCGVKLRTGRQCWRCREAQKPRKPREYHEPTTEELDALIAQQMQHLPPWWPREAKLFAEGKVE
jgi:hypothetical protein